MVVQLQGTERYRCFCTCGPGLALEGCCVKGVTYHNQSFELLVPFSHCLLMVTGEVLFVQAAEQSAEKKNSFQATFQRETSEIFH